jgi:hypothetical protein
MASPRSSITELRLAIDAAKERMNACAEEVERLHASVNTTKQVLVQTQMETDRAYEEYERLLKIYEATNDPLASVVQRDVVRAHAAHAVKTLDKFKEDARQCTNAQDALIAAMTRTLEAKKQLKKLQSQLRKRDWKRATIVARAVRRL